MPKKNSSKALFDLTDVEGLASIGCTQHEIAAKYGVTGRCFEQHLAKNRSLRDAWDRGKAKGKMSLRHKLFKLADTHPAAAIFLAKNYLGMRDVVQTEMSGPGGAAIEINDVSAKDRLIALLDRAAAKRAADGGDSSLDGE